MAKYVILLLCLVALSFSSIVVASDPKALQDFCVADNTSSVNINGFACKNPKDVTADDFLFRGLDKPGNTNNPQGSKVTPVFVTQFPGLNTFGISMARIDFAPWGLNPPHIHPRATELLVVLEGTLEVGFVTSAPDNKLFRKVLNKGDVFIFPIGLVHFQRNIGNKNAVALAGLSSQNPGVVPIAATLFGSNPDISDEVLAKAFQVDKSIVDQIQAKF